MAKNIDSIKHNKETRVHIPSKEEAGYDEAFDRLYGHISHPIEITKKDQKIAVRMISQFGEKGTKVISV